MDAAVDSLFALLRVVAPLASAVAAGSYIVAFEVVVARAVGSPGPAWHLRADRGAAEPPPWEPGSSETAPSMPMIDRIVVLSAAILMLVVTVGAWQGNRGSVLAGAVLLVALASWLAIAPVTIVLNGPNRGEVRRRHHGLRDAAVEVRLLRDLIETGGDLPERWSSDGRPVTGGG